MRVEGMRTLVDLGETQLQALDESLVRRPASRLSSRWMNPAALGRDDS
jgi:hypothetical protein